MNRRSFLKHSTVAASSAFMFNVVPATVFGKSAPSNRIGIGMIGTGRQAMQVNFPGFSRIDNCQVVAINDVDAWRLASAKAKVLESYGKQGRTGAVRAYGDYRQVISDPDVDAVMVSTADHWHAPATISAALAGKHVCMEKAFTIAPMHGKAVVEAVKVKGVANRLDSEFRSLPAFHRAVELVHNGAIGKVTEVIVGVPEELNGSAIGPQPTMDIPKELNYDMWLGPAFPAPYTLKRVHDPKTISTRPGWLRIKDYCNGMITNWGAHLNDIALWGIKKEYEHPVTVEGTGTFDQGLWNTISSFDLTYTYADGLRLLYKIDQPYVKFVGETGWVRVQYSDKLTASSDSILKFKPGKNDVSYAKTPSDKADFVQSITSGQPSMEPLEVGYNVYLLTMMGLISVQLGQKLTWDQTAGRFVNNSAANSLLTRPFRETWLDQHVVDWMKRFQAIHTL
ncbi:MAG: Gfo/Idh/MocA family oxidoreductase [Planctomycetes bacterium]|nr:Gfo/Idh/MocA family oxidoreductase [Planctomycetota bacterium]